MRSSPQAERGLGAIANDESPHRLLPNIAGGDLCPDIPQGFLRHPDVGAQQGEDRFVRIPPVMELEPWNAQPLLEYLRVVAGRAPGQSAPQVQMVGRRHGEADDFTFPENRFHHVDVRNVHSPAEGIVHDEDVPRIHLQAVLLQQGFHGVRHRTQVQRYGDALGDHLPARVAQGGGVIQAVPDDGGVRGAVKGQRHLVRPRGERILNDFTSDGVDRRAHFSDQRLSDASNLWRNPFPHTLPDDLHIHLETGLSASLADASGRRDVLVVAARGDPHMPLVDQTLVGGIEADPTQVRQQAFDPGMGRISHSLLAGLGRSRSGNRKTYREGMAQDRAMAIMTWA